MNINKRYSIQDPSNTFTIDAQLLPAEVFLKDDPWEVLKQEA